uniref:Uncharacterized protein n=1 Tax=Anguilla anguilla TaxID=7936 RepID=A0A0E9WUM3_ANGAN
MFYLGITIACFSPCLCLILVHAPLPPVEPNHFLCLILEENVSNQIAFLPLL